MLAASSTISNYRSATIRGSQNPFSREGIRKRKRKKRQQSTSSSNIFIHPLPSASQPPFPSFLLFRHHRARQLSKPSLPQLNRQNHFPLPKPTAPQRKIDRASNELPQRLVRHWDGRVHVDSQPDGAIPEVVVVVDYAAGGFVGAGDYGGDAGGAAGAGDCCCLLVG